MRDEWKTWLLRYSVELVVIFTGITLSFAFEEWRNERQDRAQEQLLLSELSKDLIEKAEELIEDSLGFANMATELSPYLLTSKSAGTIHAQSKQTLIALQPSFYYFYPTTVTYRIAVQEGGLKLIKTDSLRRMIVNLHEYRFVNLYEAYSGLQAFERTIIQPLSSAQQWQVLLRGKGDGFQSRFATALASEQTLDAAATKQNLTRSLVFTIGHNLGYVRRCVRAIEQRQVALGAIQTVSSTSVTMSK